MLNNKDIDDYMVSASKLSGSSISRKAVAKFILDSLESGKYEKQIVP